VDLPLKRDREIKRMPRYLDLVRDIEDKMVNLSGAS
jgi:hypothetical protein